LRRAIQKNSECQRAPKRSPEIKTVKETRGEEEFRSLREPVQHETLDRKFNKVGYE
jgi:hypothetical protein